MTGQRKDQGERERERERERDYSTFKRRNSVYCNNIDKPG
jgi:hypothetical protein